MPQARGAAGSLMQLRPVDSSPWLVLGGGVLSVAWTWWLPREMGRIRARAASRGGRPEVIDATMEKPAMKIALKGTRLLGYGLIALGTALVLTGLL